MFSEPTPTGIHLSSGITGGDLAPASAAEPTWGYVKNYFFVSPWDSVSALTLDLRYTAGDGYWTPFVDPGSGETWYRKSAQYDLIVSSDRGHHFVCMDSEANFVVRQQPGTGIWQLVEWYDVKPMFEDLQDKDDVLFYLEAAYNDRNLEHINKLLDDEFIFFFSPEDFGSGNTPETWGWTEEITATSNMFSGQGPNPVTHIDVELTFAPDNWTSFVPPQAPTEIWYEKSLAYDITILAGDFTFRGLDLNMTVQIRYVDVGGEEIWRLVQWRDNPGFVEVSRGALGSPAIEEVTWGGIKSFYY
jgi:hypothetical protein